LLVCNTGMITVCFSASSMSGQFVAFAYVTDDNSIKQTYLIASIAVLCCCCHFSIYTRVTLLYNSHEVTNQTPVRLSVVDITEVSTASNMLKRSQTD
jgi:hypothetical protein